MSEKEDLNRLIEAYFEKRIEYRKLSLKLKQLLNNIYYLKSNFGSSKTEEFKLDGGEISSSNFFVSTGGNLTASNAPLQAGPRDACHHCLSPAGYPRADGGNPWSVR